MHIRMQQRTSSEMSPCASSRCDPEETKHDCHIVVWPEHDLRKLMLLFEGVCSWALIPEQNKLRARLSRPNMKMSDSGSFAMRPG